MYKISIFALNIMDMKKILGLFAFTLFFNGCDDGDIIIETIDFEDVTAVNCNLNDLLYKIKDSEALIIEMDNSENYYTNNTSETGSPTTVTINNSTNKVIYRSYSGEVATGNICATIPLASPNVIEEWVATAGTIEITTTANVVPNSTSTAGNATKVSGYTHHFEFKNITFLKPNGEQQFYSTYSFGDYVRNTNPYPFGFDEEDVKKCSITNEFYNFSGKESFVLNLDSSIYSGTAGTNTKVISATNKVSYKLFESTLSDSYFCSTTSPTTPVLSEEWKAVDGVSGVSGEIEIIATQVGSQFEYKIYLKKVTLKRGNSQFYLGDNYYYGTILN